MRQGSRSERIHHRLRVKKNRKHHFGMSEQTEKQSGKFAFTPTPCSCRMCGNPRKYAKNSALGKTLQELRAMEDAKDQI